MSIYSNIKHCAFGITQTGTVIYFNRVTWINVKCVKIISESLISYTPLNKKGEGPGWLYGRGLSLGHRINRFKTDLATSTKSKNEILQFEQFLKCVRKWRDRYRCRNMSRHHTQQCEHLKNP